MNCLLNDIKEDKNKIISQCINIVMLANENGRMNIDIIKKKFQELKEFYKEQEQEHKDILLTFLDVLEKDFVKKAQEQNELIE